MILQENLVDVVRSEKFEENLFSIKATAKSFKILSSGIYSNKHKAVLREIGTNAADSHMEAGKPEVPFLVHLPNHFESFLSIRDFGTGISPENIKNIYTTYFSSTRSNSNDFTGTLGIGSKSCFSYCDNFTVTSWFNGMKYIYSAFISENGFPSIALIHSDETSEGNGLEVSFAVKPVDFSKFGEEARSVYQHFKVRPKIVGQNIVFLEEKVLFSGPGWSISRGNSGHFAVMGNVSYPIALYNVGINDNIFNYYNLKLDVPIGEIEMTASRESLEYTPRTNAAIKLYYNDMIKVFKENMQKELDEKSTLWEATIFYAENSILLVASPKWNGKYISNNILLPNTNCKRFTNSYKVRMKKDVHISYINPSLNIIFVEDDLLRGGLGRIREWMEKQAGKDVYVLRFATPAEKKFFFDCLGTLPVGVHILSSTLPKVASTYSVKKEPAPTTFTFTGSNRDLRSEQWEICKDFDIEEGGVYLELENWSIVPDISGNYLKSILCSLEKLSRKPVLYGLRKKTADKARGEADWITLQNYVKDVLKNYEHEYDNVVNMSDYMKYENLIVLSKKMPTADLTNFLSRVEYVKKNTEYLMRISYLMNFVDIHHVSKIDVDAEMETYKNKYPLVFFIVESGYGISSIPANAIENYVKMVDNQAFA